MVATTGRPGRESGVVTLELVVAIGIMVTALMAIAYSYHSERQMLLATYHRAVAVEAVDGEMEVLLAGEWRSWAEGEHDYKLAGDAPAALPAGRCTLTIGGGRVRLEWRPSGPRSGGAVAREARVR